MADFNQTNMLQDVLGEATGARFHRADLHIHSFGGSHDVTDTSMTPEAIVATAAREGLAMISITDHNEITNVDAAIRASQEAPVVVVPGVELSTSQGHLLCYLPNLNLLRRFFGQIAIVDHGRPTSRCQQSIFECLNFLEPLGGFGVLAHVDVATGFEIEQPRPSQHKVDVLCHRALMGVEVRKADTPISYAPGDPDPERVKMGRERISRLGLGSKQYIARVLNSDSHKLNALGRNAENARRVTRYKMDTPSFDALRVALDDADARVRIEDLIPQSVPRVLGLKMDGGFLSGQMVQFSPNLNCIVGGRGTGKSLTFESVRCLANDPGTARVTGIIDSEVWPEELYLFWEDKAGQKHSLYRQKGGDIQNLDDEDTGQVSFDLDCFGQGEAARISIEAQSNPLALLEYLDKFVDLDQALSDESGRCEELERLEGEIAKAEDKVKLIPQYEALLTTTKRQPRSAEEARGEGADRVAAPACRRECDPERYPQ